MSEVGGITELQMLEGEVTLLKKKLDGCESAEKTSSCCSRIASSVTSAEIKDGFLMREGGPPNAFHTSAGTAAKGGCCIVL
jgi:hypothetical protein